MKEKITPQNIEAEKALLGSMFMSRTSLEKACEEVEKEYFYLDAHAKIFDVMKDLYNRKLPVDISSVVSELNEKALINQIGGAIYLDEIINSVATGANIEYYIEKVIDKYVGRRIIENASLITAMAYDSSVDANDLIDDAEKKFLNISRNRRAGEFRNIQDVLSKTQEDLEKLAQNKGAITGVASGLGDLDRMTAGFHPHELIILASRPAMGKTALALNIASSVAKSTKQNVALFSLEMGAEQLAMRMISSAGQISASKLKTGKLENEDWRRVNEAISQLADTKIFIHDSGGATISEIKAKCRRLAAQDSGLALIVIDYLQLVQGSAKNVSNRQQEISEISRTLKTMAMELNVPVIALSQLSRDVEKREDKRPVLSDLRESGSIEQDADIVMALYRDDYYNKSKEETPDSNSLSELIILKHRNGPTGKIDLLFKKDTSTFLSFRKETE